MSIANDVRSYAGSAIGQAQARLTEARGEATELASKAMSRASVTYAELRTRGEALTKQASAHPAVERASATVEPYVAQLKGYGSLAAELLEQAYAELRKNDQIAKLIAVAETSIDAVQERVTSLLDRQAAAPAPAAASSESPAKPVAAAKAKPAATRPAKVAAAKATPAKRTTTGRAPKA